MERQALAGAQAERACPRVDGRGGGRLRTNRYALPAGPGKTVEPRLDPSCVEVRDAGRGGATGGAATNAISKSSTWNTSSTCWRERRARWPDRNRSRRGAHEDYGRRVTIACSKR